MCVALRPPNNLLCLNKQKSSASAALGENKINTTQVHEIMESPRKLSINNCGDGPEITYCKIF